MKNPKKLDGPTFFAWAYRCAAYAGVLQARVQAEAQAQREENGDESFGTTPSARARVVESTSDNLLNDPGLAGLFEKGGSPE